MKIKGKLGISSQLPTNVRVPSPRGKVLNISNQCTPRTSPDRTSDSVVISHQYLKTSLVLRWKNILDIIEGAVIVYKGRDKSVVYC